MRKTISILIFLLLMYSCKEFQKVSDIVTNPSAREVFERNLKENDSIFKHYETLYAVAKQNNLKLNLPVGIISKTDTINVSVLAYSIDLKRGERLKIASDIKTDSLQLSMDVFSFKNDSIVSNTSIVSNKPKTNFLDLDVAKNGTYKIVIVSENKKNINFSIKIFTEPTFLFPVSGKNNKAIQSFWGAPRSGGKRSHKGIDIFAKRGTPVIAAVDGFVSSARNAGLGGKQVWLRSGIFGSSLYYAHLDSIAVSRGNSIKVGDTLGFVGNTGNARTTSPHLHFGIYTNSGAIDPLPFVKLKEPPKTVEEEIFIKGVTKFNINQMRIGTSVKNKKIEEFAKNKEVTILSKINNWYHVRVKDSLEGFMHQSLILKID